MNLFVVILLSRLSHCPVPLEWTTNRAHADMMNKYPLEVLFECFWPPTEMWVALIALPVGYISHIRGHLSLHCFDGTWNLRDFESQTHALINAFNMSWTIFRFPVPWHDDVRGHHTSPRTVGQQGQMEERFLFVHAACFLLKSAANLQFFICCANF